jgi:hypothetical protein
LKGYEHNTAEKKADFEKLREKDKQSAATIDSQTRKLNRLQVWTVPGCWVVLVLLFVFM